MSASPAGPAPPGRSVWLWLYWGVLALGFAFVLAINLPGQMSFDTVMQLYEGRNNHQVTFNPWIMSWALGLTDKAVRGAGLFMLLTDVVLFGSLAALPLLRARIGPWAVVALAAVLLTPQIINYQGIVWKDVVFANLTIAAFVTLAFALRWKDRPRLRLAALVKTVLLLAVAGLVRQNGLIAAPLAALALGIAEGQRLGWRRGALLGVGGFAAVLAMAFVLGAGIRPAKSDLKANSVGLLVILHYDLVGAVARDPALDLGPVPAANAAVIRRVGPRIYTPERVDSLDDDAEIGPALWHTPKPAVMAAWKSIVLHHPGLYLRHRLAVYRWTLLTPDIARCVPVAVGVDGPAQYLDALGLKEGVNRRDVFLSNYSNAFYNTPVLSHLTYALLAVVLIAVLALRRQPSDLAIIGLLLAGLGFAASFFLLSIACDYRYLYLLDLATLVSLVYWALDPPPLKLHASRPA